MSNQLDQLRLYLSERAAFYVVYRVQTQLKNEIDLEFIAGSSAYDYSMSEVAEYYKVVARDCFRMGKSGMMSFDSSWPANSDGRQWRCAILATGPTLEAGYVIVIKVLAIDDNEMQEYGRGIQRIMKGEDARMVPRPGGLIAS